jgi:hypothetical protein
MQHSRRHPSHADRRSLKDRDFRRPARSYERSVYLMHENSLDMLIPVSSDWWMLLRELKARSNLGLAK